jgi:hypothetical protein
MERRELFKIITAGALVPPAAAQTAHHHAAAPAASQREPFFTAAEHGVLDRLADIIIPADEQSPGAHDAGVVRYLDVFAAVAAAPRRQQWRQGLAAVDALAQGRFGHGFAACTRPQQEEIVGVMAAHEGAPQTDVERFFEILKPAVVDGYRFSETGVKQYMGWVGNQFDVKNWNGACTHPEHGA